MLIEDVYNYSLVVFQHPAAQLRGLIGIVYIYMNTYGMRKENRYGRLLGAGLESLNMYVHELMTETIYTTLRETLSTGRTLSIGIRY